MSDNLSYKGFKKVIVSQVRKEFDGKYGDGKIVVKKMRKNNDVMLDALLLERGNGECSPCLYVSDLYRGYENGANIQEITDAVKDLFVSFMDMKMPKGREIDDFFDDLDRAAPFIGCSLINADVNRRRLEGVPYRRIGEFALSYNLRVSDGEGGSYVTQITDEMMQAWDIDEDALYDRAVRNMNFPGNFVLRKARGNDDDPEDDGVFLLTIKGGVYGATVLVSDEVKKKVAGYLGGDYYIVPASVHELMVVSKKYIPDPENLRSIVRRAGEAAIGRSDAFLSSNLYEYDTSKGQMLMVS